MRIQKRLQRILFVKCSSFVAPGDSEKCRRLNLWVEIVLKERKLVTSMSESEFYLLETNGSASSGAARFRRVHAEKDLVSACTHCKSRTTEPAGIILMDVSSERGSFWPDATQCFGSFQGLYISERVGVELDAAKIRYGKAFPAEVQGHFPKKLEKTIPPKYLYLASGIGAKFDFAEAGMSVEFICPSCGQVRRKAQEVGKHCFVVGSWNGSDIFCTDLSPATYFCTERVLELARLHRWTNFKFIPLAEAHDYGHQGIDYLS